MSIKDELGQGRNDPPAPGYMLYLTAMLLGMAAVILLALLLAQGLEL